jgi:hypothetical protein
MKSWHENKTPTPQKISPGQSQRPPPASRQVEVGRAARHGNGNNARTTHSRIRQPGRWRSTTPQATAQLVGLFVAWRGGAHGRPARPGASAPCTPPLPACLPTAPRGPHAQKESRPPAGGSGRAHACARACTCPGDVTPARARPAPSARPLRNLHRPATERTLARTLPRRKARRDRT